MLDIRAIHYPSPLSEVDFASVPLSVRLKNYADETGEVTGTFRVYNDTTGLLIHTSEIAPVTVAAGVTVDVDALTDFDPPAPADDVYFVIFDGVAKNTLVPDGISIHRGAWYFDVKPVGMGPAPAAHHATHEDGGSDEIDVTGLVGLTGPHDFMDLAENAAPGLPAANTARIFAEDKAGHTILAYNDAGGMKRHLVRDSVFIGWNATGVLIPKLSIVRSVGNVGSLPSIALAKADAAATMPAIGIALEAIADGTSGRIMQVGLIENINTSAIAPGARVWVSSTVAGGVQITAPVWPALRQEIGVILIQDALVGTAQVIARSAFDDGVINHAALMNLTAGDPHTQYAKRATFELFTANDTWTKPADAQLVRVVCVGAGGGGGGGCGDAAATARAGGGGGGGGALSFKIFPASALTATVAVTVGTAGSAGTGGTAASGTAGGVGGASSFGSYLSAFGGGGGKGGVTAAVGAGGGGGGTCGPGATASGTGAAAGGYPGSGSTRAIGGQGAQSNAQDNGGFAEFGGGSGAGNSPATPMRGQGGGSVFAAGGGAAGACVTTANVGDNGNIGGATNLYGAGGGGAAGIGAGANGGNGAAGDGIVTCGAGGGSGASHTAGTGGTGGTGGAPGGGGGGGGAGTNVGGNGGAGQRGEVRVEVWF